MSKLLKCKRALLAILSVVLVVCLFAAMAVQAKRERKEFVLPDTSSAEVQTNRYAQYKEAAQLAGNRLTTEGFEKVLENDNLELWLRKEIAAIRVVDKQSGYVWGELETDTVDNLNEYWTLKANSMFTVEYYDKNNTSYQLSMGDEGFSNTYEFDTEANVMTCVADSYDIGLAVTFEVALKDDHLEMEIVEGGIEEYDENYMLSKIFLLPFFGCTKHGEMDGYIFVPDGSGALMRFDPNTVFTSYYLEKLYGKDGSVDTINEITDLMAKRTDDYLVDTHNATVPVFGIVHGAEQYAAMTVVESGNEYASIQASLASSITPYNWVSSIFEYRQLYSQPVSKSNSIIRPQEEINEFVPRISVYLMSGDDASYNGMALKYREMLEADGTLEAAAKTYDEQVPLRLEVLGSDVKKGFIFNGTQTFTSAEEALEIQKALSDKGISNLTMVLTGWQKGGVNGNKYGKYTTQSTVGSLEDLATLRDSVKAAGGNFYLQSEVVRFNELQGRISYLGAQSMAKKLIFYLRDNPAVMFQHTYVATPQVVVSNLKTASTELKGFNLNLPRFGSELYAHYEQEETTTRDETRKLFEKTADKLVDSDMKVSMNAPNQYMWDKCNDYFDIPMMNSQHLFETDSVPFLQILLKGHINYYAPYANQGFYTTACTLKTIEYGAYPSFLVMAAGNGDLNKTPMVDYFSLNYKDWEGTIETVYGKVNAALMEVQGAKMTEHKVLAEGVVRISYDNGARIYVNYNAKDVTIDGVQVKGLNFAVERG